MKHCPFCKHLVEVRTESYVTQGGRVVESKICTECGAVLVSVLKSDDDDWWQVWW